MRMKHKAPVRKLTAATIGGAVATLVIWLIEAYVLGTEVNDEIRGAITMIVVFFVGYYTPPSAYDVMEETDPQAVGNTPAPSP